MNGYGLIQTYLVDNQNESKLQDKLLRQLNQKMQNSFNEKELITLGNNYIGLTDKYIYPKHIIETNFEPEYQGIKWLRNTDEFIKLVKHDKLLNNYQKALDNEFSYLNDRK